MEFKNLLFHLFVLIGRKGPLTDVVHRSRLVRFIVAKFSLSTKRTLYLYWRINRRSYEGKVTCGIAHKQNAHMHRQTLHIHTHNVFYLQCVWAQQSVSNKWARQSTWGYVFTQLQAQQVPAGEKKGNRLGFSWNEVDSQQKTSSKPLFGVKPVLFCALIMKQSH